MFLSLRLISWGKLIKNWWGVPFGLLSEKIEWREVKICKTDDVVAENTKTSSH